jgi:hypothetical protein
MIPPGEAGVVLHLSGGHQRAAELAAFEHQRGELGARRVDRGGIPGRTRPDDDDVSNWASVDVLLTVDLSLMTYRAPARGRLRVLQ